MSKYIIKATIYDHDQERWETKLGIQGKHLELHYSVWAKTEIDSKKKAEELALILTKSK